jgi:hypothetical protein
VELLPDRTQTEANMYDYARPASLGPRDVIAAWLVCLTIMMAVFVYPGFSPEPAREAQAASRNAAPAVSPTELCASRIEPAAAPHG